MSRPVRFLICTLVSVIFVLPLLAMVVVAFTPRGVLFEDGASLWPSGWTTENFTGLFEQFPVRRWFANALVVAVLTTILSVTVNLLCGFALATLRFRGRTAVLLLILGTLMIPTQAIMIPQFELVSRLGLIGLLWAVILPSASTALGVFLARQFFVSFPSEIIDAARVDGCGTLRAFVKVVLPNTRPLLAVMTLLAFMNQWNEFLWPLIALRDPDLYTLPVALRLLQTSFDNDYGGIMAMALLSSLPLVILFVVLQRYFVAGLARSGIK